MTNETPKKEFYMQPGFIAACVVILGLLVLPIISFMGTDIKLILGSPNFMDLPGGGLYKVFLFGAIATSGTYAYAVFNGGKNEKLSPEKLKWTPLSMTGAFILYGLIDDLELGQVGLGVWLGLLGSLVIAFEAKIMGMIKK